MTSSLPTQGFSILGVEVLSIEGDRALVRDQMGRQHKVPLTVQRAHGVLPQPGESWLIDRALSNEWTFAAIIGGDIQKPVQAVPDAATRNAIRRPYLNMAVYQLSTYSIWVWSGTAWVEQTGIPAHIAAAINARPRGVIGLVRRLNTDVLSSTSFTIMETLTVPVVAGRSYEIKWSCNQASSLAAGPPNATAAIITSLPPLALGPDPIRSGNIRVYNATAEIVELTAQFDATVTESRAFGAIGTPNSGSATITFFGGSGRFFKVTDNGPTP